MKKHQRYLLATLLALSANNATSITVLRLLGVQLREMRALPIGAPTRAGCPTDTETMKGAGRDLIEKNLGRPDSTREKSRVWTYFLTSPVPPTQLGGGFPELSFTFDRDRRVTEISCHYSR